MAKEEKGPEKLKFHVFRDERFIDLNLYQFGWERTSPTHSYGPYARNHYLFHYIIEGRGISYNLSLMKFLITTNNLSKTLRMVRIVLLVS